MMNGSDALAWIFYLATTLSKRHLILELDSLEIQNSYRPVPSDWKIGFALALT
jgi:hypothetical protein